MEESKRTEAIGRATRQVNEGLEALAGALCSEKGASKATELRVTLDLQAASDEQLAAATDLSELLACAQASAATQAEAAQAEEASFVQLEEQQRELKDHLAGKERECRRFRERLDQLMQLREEYREWSGTQLDEATRTAETTEDAVHAVSVGTAAPSIRDAAEIDKLRLTLHAMQTQGVNERGQLEEQVKRDAGRYEDHKDTVLHHLELYLRDVETLHKDLEAVLQAEGAEEAARTSVKAGRGGCREA